MGEDSRNQLAQIVNYGPPPTWVDFWMVIDDFVYVGFILSMFVIYLIIRKSQKQYSTGKQIALYLGGGVLMTLLGAVLFVAIVLTYEIFIK